MTTSLSSNPSSLLRHHPDEQTPLLEANGAANETSLAKASSSPDQPQEGSEERVNGNAKLQDDEGQDRSIGSGSTSENENEATSKTSIGIVGMISVLLLGVFIANADGSIVMATYGIISSELGSLESASWLVVTYGLAMCAVQPTYGKLSDIYGRKSTLIVAYSFFAVGCAICGAGQTIWQVVVGRMVAGIGGAGMTVLVSIIIADRVPVRNVATWRGYVNIASTVGRSAGGPMGGYLADTIGWRWSFYIQSPLAIVAILLVFWKFDSPEPSLSGYKTVSTKRKLRRVDFLGSLTLAIATTGFLLALDLGGQKIRWTHPIIWILLSLSAVVGIIFLLVEAYVAQEPIFPLRLLIHRDVVTAYLITGLQSCAQFGVMYTVPLYFQVTARTSVTAAGTHLVPAVCGNAIGGLISGIYIKRTASYKSLTIFGLAAASIGYLLLILTWRGHTNIWESLYIAPGGFGTGIAMSTTFILLAAGVEESQMAIASTGLYQSANVGGLTGASLASSVLQGSLRKGLEKGLEDFPDRQNVRIFGSYTLF
ncbi:hypothetical protein MMC22_002466 [Lobaria immixta]|nr:hypothetical protein [Lobaria immixta]